MVHLESINDMVDKDLDNFYSDRDRFKGLKMIIDFDSVDLNAETPEMKFSQPKFKKRQTTSTYIKSNPNKKSLF